MMQFVHRLRRGWLLMLVIVWVLALAGPLALPTAAQDDPDPAAEIEALALQAHLQNIRQDNYTAWIGGDLGPAQWAPSRTPLGETLDEWALDGFLGDDDMTLEDITRPTLLNFWASWCGPCRAEFPHLAEIATHPDDYNMDVVFVNTSDTPEDARDFLTDYPQELVTVVDRNDRLSNQTSVEALPTTILIDTDGTVLAVHIGMMSPSVSEFLNAVAAHPGVGSFEASEYQDVEPGAILDPVDVDAAEPISAGETVEGTIDDEHTQAAYVFEGAAGDEVTIEMTATDGQLDCYVALMTADEERLGENDDIERGVITDSSLTVTLPDDGTYVIVATRFLEAQGLSSGGYDLTLTIAPVAPPDDGTPPPQTDDGWTQRVGDGFIGYNTAVEGTVDGNNPQQLYAFEAQAGDVVTLTLTHTEGDAPLSLEVKDTHQNRFAVSEPSEDGLTTLENLELPEAGYYRVRVYRDRERAGVGMDFTLALALVEGELPLNAPNVPGAQGDVDLVYGGEVTGEITDEQYEQRWTFNGQAGDRVTIVMTREVDEPGGLDGYLLLEGPGGNVVTEVDDAQGSVMPALENYALPETGVYTIVATRFGFASGFSVGRYSVSLNAQGGAPPPPEDTSGLRWFTTDFPSNLHWLGYNQTAAGVVDDENAINWYIFQGREGDVLTIRMEADDSDLDSQVILTDANGYELASNDDFEGSLDATITGYTLPANGTYLIRASRYGVANGPSSGAYVLVIETDAEPVESGDLASVAYGDSVSGDLSLENPVDRYTFEGQAGDEITLALQPTEGDVPLVEVRGPDGSVVLPGVGLAYKDGRQSIPVTLTEDGLYTIEVQPADLNEPGGYRLLVLGRPTTAVDAGAFEPDPDVDVEVVLIWDAPVDLSLNVTRGDDTDALAPVAEANAFCDEVLAPAVERVTDSDLGDALLAYHVTVAYSLNCGGQTQPVDFVLVIAQNGVVTDIIGGTLAGETDSYTTWFAYQP